MAIGKSNLKERLFFRRSAFSNNTFLFALALALGVLYLSVYYGPVLQEPNSYQFTSRGDGVKAYYSLAYHVVHDSSWWHFEGMNHPFGDHLHYPDAQPILANSLKALAHVFPAAGEQAVGWVNSYMLLGLLLGCPFLVLLFRELGATPFVALILAFSAWILCPQSLRLRGHFGLAHAWVIPAVLWAFLKALQGSRLHALLVFLFTCCAVWTHPYLAAISTSTVLLYSVISYFSIERARTSRRTFILAVISMLPLFLFMAVDTLGPRHDERINYPLGFFDYLLSSSNLLSNASGVESPFHLWVFGDLVERSWEGSCYPGIALILMLGAILVHWTTRSSGSAKAFIQAQRPLSFLFIASAILLLYAAGLPFRLGLESFVWDVPYLKQFRSIGRFSWPFYFLLYAVCAVLITKWGILNSRPYLLRVLLIALCVSNLYEAHYVHSKHRRALIRSNQFDRSNPPKGYITTLNSINKTEGLRAILPLPYYHYGTDAILLGGDAHASEDAMIVSFHTGLPLMSSSIAKTSIHEAQTLSSLYLPSTYKNPLMELFKHDDKIALLELPPLPPCDTILRQGSIELPSSEKHRLHLSTAGNILQPKDLFSDRSIQELINSIPQRTSSSWYGGDTLFYFDFDDRDSPISFMGKGAYELSNEEEIKKIVHFEPGALSHGKSYVLSFWCNNSRATSDFAMFMIQQTKEGESKEDWAFESDGRRARIRDAGWSYLEMPFDCQSKGVLDILCHRALYFPNSVIIDELLVREKGDMVIMKNKEDEVLLNGIPIKARSEQ